jgi:uncharacterized membrane-anchored protein
MLRPLVAAVCGIFLAIAPMAVHAQSVSSQDAASADDPEARAQAFLSSLHQIRGTVKLPEAGAELHLGADYYFLDKEDARRVIVDAWGNPSDQADGVLGLIVPANGNVLNDWAAVVTYQPSGYVSDTDAEKQDYDSVLKQIRDGEAQDNETRKKAGFAAMHLVGWAQPPSYDKVNHSLIWARDLQVEGSKNDALNYDVRLLGRKGVLSLNMIDIMPDLPAIRSEAVKLAATGQFVPGERYTDYQEGDKKSAYGLAGLVAAGLGVAVAKKLGLLAILLVVLKKGFVFILAGLAAAGRWFGGVFGLKPKPRRPTHVLSSSDLPESTPAITERNDPPPPPTVS